uniref:hypothetical protein n=1 Tax=Aquimarina sp. I32.4 TaxID=2053903 RepID=UPI0011AF9455
MKNLVPQHLLIVRVISSYKSFRRRIWRAYDGNIFLPAVCLPGYSMDTDPHSGHIDPSVAFGLKKIC